MVDDETLREAREAEQALLRRCHAFILGGPQTPGGCPEDVVYLTPDGRWLRVCSAGLLGGYAHPGAVEGVVWLSSRAVAELFDSYNHPQPAELPKNTSRDLEVHLDAIPESKRHVLIQMDPEGIKVLSYFMNKHINTLRAAAVDSSPLIDSQAIRKRLRPEEPLPNPTTFDEYCKEFAHEAYIPRNSLLDRLRLWSADWPPPPRELAASLTTVQARILWTLSREGVRFSKTKLLEVMGKHGYGTSETGLMESLGHLMRLGLVDNDRTPKAISKGYGLTQAGRQVSKHIQQPEPDRKSGQ